MKYTLYIIAFFFAIASVSAQGPKGKDFGFGLIIGEPTGATIKYWTGRENAFDAYIGGSYFGKIRVGGDYLWHFNAFNSNIINLYAGPGIAMGFGESGGILYKKGKDLYYYRDDGGVGIGIRAIMGINIVPKRTPLEIFFEMGPFIGLIPETGFTFEGAIGIRFYP